ncbi:MAG: outer membrane lipoprotein-sorting protein, partial [Puniceicoccaceae bacterium]
RFIHEAPLENILVRRRDPRVELSLGEDVTIARKPCYQIVAAYNDGSKVIHCIEKETYLERRIYQYDDAGELVAEMIPSDFEQIDGILFAMTTIRVNPDGESITMTMDSVQSNVGILDTAFSPPQELPEE